VNETSCYAYRKHRDVPGLSKVLFVAKKNSVSSQADEMQPSCIAYNDENKKIDSEEKLGVSVLHRYPCFVQAWGCK